MTDEPNAHHGERRYKAFISYSHRDKAHAEALHRRLENFKTPKKLVGQQGARGEIPRRLRPIFRDREELPSGAELGPELQKALRNSEFLLVLCSPGSANSIYVNEEIKYFRQIHGDDRVLAAIVDGEPGACVGEGEQGCFPPALIAPAEGSDTPREPIAADFRDHADGPRLAFQKLSAGMLGVGVDALVQRMAQRRQKRMAQIGAGMAALIVALSGLTIYAFQQERIADEQRAIAEIEEARAIEQQKIAEKERDDTEAALDFFASIFEIANPATENPKTITALTILDRGRDKIDVELAGRPDVQAKLMGAIGRVYFNLGEIEGAREILEATMANVEDDETAAATALSLSDIAYRMNDSKTAKSYIQRARKAIDALRTGGETQLADSLWSQSLAIEGAVVGYIDFDKPRAVELMNEAKNTITASPDPDVKKLADLNSALGTLYADMNEPSLAMEPLEQAMKGYQTLFGDDHVLVARAAHNLALAHFKAKALEEAAASSEKAIEIWERILDPKHPNLGMGRMLLGRVYAAMDDLPRARRNLLSSAEKFRDGYGEKNAWRVVPLIYLAQFEAEKGQADNAHLRLDEARALYDEIYPPGNANHGDLKVYRSLAVKAAGNLQLARETCAEGLQIMRDSGASDESWLAENTAICKTL